MSLEIKKHLTYFANSIEIGNGYDVDLPNVSYLEGKNVLYIPGENSTATIKVNSSGKIEIELPIDYSTQYLTFEALENGTFSFYQYQINSNMKLNYSIDNGNTWQELSPNTQTASLSTGSKILWKYEKTQYYDGSSSAHPYMYFQATGNFKAYGNVMSVIYGDNFLNQVDLTNKEEAFYRLFNNNTKLVDASNLILPATTLSDTCYSQMFQGCTSLTTAPELPAQTLTLQCYSNMFSGCTKLSYIKMLATDISAWACLSSWLNNVSATGTFIKAASMTTLPSGGSGIPEGWTVQDA